MGGHSALRLDESCAFTSDNSYTESTILTMSTQNLFLVGLLARGVWLQGFPATERVDVECLGSFARLKLNPSYFRGKYVSFAAIDKFGRSWKINEALATQCGYSLFRDVWGNLELHASLIGCYAQIVDDQQFVLIIEITTATNLEMYNSAVFRERVSCSYSQWQPREIVCEANYMEVSVRRNVPPIPDGFLQDQPEDWVAALPEVTVGEPSIWQIVFHMDSGKKAMLVEEAHSSGYGVNTTDTRIVLRASYNATEAQRIEINRISFSTVRSTIYYKQHWMLLMVDTAVACPIDGVTYTNDTIIWTVPKRIPPLLSGADNMKELQVEMGINLYKLSAQDIVSRGYLLISDKEAITVKIPIGATGGSYKSYVTAGQPVFVYQINLFVVHLWEDDKRGVTKHIIVKEISTPQQSVSIVVKDGTNSTSQQFDVTVGTFLPDIELERISVGHLGPLSLPNANKLGWNVYGTELPNGSREYTVKFSFDAPGVEKEYVPDNNRNYTANVTFGFNVFPQGEKFNVSVTLNDLVMDAVLPEAVGYCDDQALYLVLKRGNVDQDWLPFVGDEHLTQEMAQRLGYSRQDNGTHLALRVPRHAAHLTYEEIHSSGIVATFQLQLKESLNEAEIMDFAISCSFSPKELIDCLPNGTVVVSAMKVVGIPDMDPSQLVLRDRNCKPSVVTEEGATFVFNLSACGTTRKFEDTTMTYENEVLYFVPGQTVPVYRLKCGCQYFIGDTLVLQYNPIEAPSPSILPGTGLLALSLKLARDKSYRDFYQDVEYPVTRYLRDPLYFQVELLHSQDPELELFLEDCWATSSSERNSSPQWNIVVDSCENMEDSHQTTFHRVPSSSVPFPTHVKRFEVKMFTFLVNSQALQGQVYFHCSAVICDARRPSSDAICVGRCIPRRQRVGRSIDSTTDLRGYVSSGAVMIQRRKDI